MFVASRDFAWSTAFSDDESISDSFPQLDHNAASKPRLASQFSSQTVLSEWFGVATMSQGVFVDW